MLVKLLITAEIELLEDRSLPEETLAASAREAIDNALALGADTGFEHELAASTSIHIGSVEILGDDVGRGPSSS